jgi:antitoxin (DNA-binding transcriptional repressor) of toxin-antitoxin stability system
MRAIGIRELKNKLSEYVRLVEAGESVLVTDRGRVVAELRPPGSTTQAPDNPDVPAGLIELARRATAVLGGPHDPQLYRKQTRVLGEGVPGALLEEERADS